MAENLGCDLSPSEVSKINSDILASFLEESLMEDVITDNDDERLTSVMQSLEAEISGASTEMKSEDYNYGSMEEFQLYDLRASPSSSSDLEFDWINDVEMSGCSSPSEEILLDYCADEIEDAVMFVDIENHTQFWDGVFLEEHGSYSSLWQQSYNSL